MIAKKLLLVSVLFLSAIARGETFNLVTENFPPFNMGEEDHKYEHKADAISGINVDIVKELFKRSGYDYRLKLRNWNYAYNFAQRKEFRGVFGTTLTDARKPLFKWVGPLAKNDWVFFARNDTTIKINSVEDAKPYLIGCYKDDSRAQFLKNNGFNASELEDDSLNPKRLQQRQVDLWISSTASGYYYAKLAGVSDIKPIFTIRDTSLYLAMNKDTPDEHIEHLNKVLDKMRTEGYLDKVYSNYK
ncbi:ABC transporter substrate-binding protein [Hahella aquimaris]|uniref:substrate-binding periplasmic protein n=1 Tax=Hahella sp. HNIBRBA332 TaxID=3015983 RepID=UPI00273C78DB|nr:ABC transporter substrate-binding protein [Hahella sp. HNIBRBA332]WLQ11582.1 ABC transporter substrate-binding protein [Hahella sp. HNIBRBA332]